MGCWGSKQTGDEEACGKLHDPVKAPLSNRARLPWAAEATKWRWLLRTSQSLVAACLYVVCTWLRLPSEAVGLQLLLAAVLVVPFMLVYHWLSLNGAGGYYDTFAEMLREVPQYVRTVSRRDGYEYRAEIEQERRNGIVRAVDGLGSGLVFLVVSWASLGIAGLCGVASGVDGADFAATFSWRMAEWTSFLALHRLVGANVFEGKYLGLLQPEALWQFECVLADCEAPGNVGVDCRMRPLLQHPNPSY
mmetsp:Transcript_102228/g.310193  ORF Transcript_102228/g.310193 Transcript_102228/m.310193 type:complete len:248 (+) Transcript_102228:3-746(+)